MISWLFSSFIAVYFTSRCVQLARQALDWTILPLEVILLEMDITVALVFVGNDFLPIHVRHFVCQGQDKIMDAKISRCQRKEPFLTTELIVPKNKNLLGKENLV